MKIYLKSIFAIGLCASLFVAGCTKQKEVNFAIVSGTLSNANGSDIVLVSNYTSISFDTVQAIKHVLKVDDKGSFIDTVYINGPREFMMMKERGSVGFVINQGQHVQLTADCKNFQNTSTFSGDFANENNYLFKKSLIFDRINAANSREKNGDEAMFSNKQERYYNEYIQLLNSYTGLKEEFISNEKKDINYSRVKSYIYYAMDYKRIHGEGESKLSSDFLDVISATNMQDYSEYKRSVGYQFLLRAYYNYKYSQAVDNIWEADPVEQLKLIAETVSDRKILEELFIMYGQSGITSTPDLQGYYDFFMSKVGNQIYRDVVIKEYKDLLVTQPGQVSPEFNGYQNIDGGTNSLSDFQRKVCLYRCMGNLVWPL